MTNLEQLAQKTSKGYKRFMKLKDMRVASKIKMELLLI